MKKLTELTENERSTIRDKKRMKSLSNESINSYSKSKSAILIKQPDTIKTKFF